MKLLKVAGFCALATLLELGAVLPAQSETLEASAQGQVENLMAIIFVTTEPVESVMERWNTPRAESPNFDVSSTVRVGETVSFVGLYAGAGRTSDGSSLLACEVTVSVIGEDPQIISLDPCVEHEPEGPLSDVYMTKGFSMPAKAEMAGKTIRIEAKMTDTGSGAAVPLAIEFEVLQAGEGGA